MVKKCCGQWSSQKICCCHSKPCTSFSIAYLCILLLGNFSNKMPKNRRKNIMMLKEATGCCVYMCRHCLEDHFFFIFINFVRCYVTSCYLLDYPLTFFPNNFLGIKQVLIYSFWCVWSSQYDPRFGDAFWNSSKFGMVNYLLRMMSSWAIVCSVWYLPPMSREVRLYFESNSQQTKENGDYCFVAFKTCSLLAICSQ